MKMIGKPAVSFLVLSDWGSEYKQDLVDMAKNMAATAADPFTAELRGEGSKAGPYCVLALGDNFYSHGVVNDEDKRWDAWVDAFVTQAPPALHVPWYVAAGNHDYHPAAGIMPEFNFAFSSKNPNGMWRMHGEPSHDAHGRRFSRDEVLAGMKDRRSQLTESGPASSSSAPLPPPPAGIAPPPPPAAPAPATRPAAASSLKKEEEEQTYYKFSIPIANSNEFVDCFVLNTCAAQFSIRRNFPHVLAEFPRQKQWLAAGLSASTARWKFVFGHHPLYTAGLGHQDEARCLRGEYYTCVNDMGKNGKLHQGLGLEQLLLDCGADAYFAGHEHAFQYTYVRDNAKAQEKEEEQNKTRPTARGFHHFVCGNAMEISWWRGRYKPPAEPAAAPPAQSNAAALADPHRSVCSTHHHVDEIITKVGVTHCEVTPDELVVRVLSQFDHTVVFCRHFPK